MNADDLATKTHRLLNRLAKWRAVFASWQLGTRSNEDGECNAVRDHREATIILRAELTALVGVLMKKGIITPREFSESLCTEAEVLMRSFEKQFPGYRAEDDGMVLDMPIANETVKKMHFPP